MSIYKDKTNGKWKVEINITGDNPHRKRKTGFNTKKEALQWEHDYVEKIKFSSNITFIALFDEYAKDFRKRSKEITVVNKEQIFKNHILPFFRNIKIDDISPGMIRKYQNEYLLEIKLKKTSINLIENQLNAILNFAVKFYNLKENPFNKVDKIGSGKTDKKLKIWTLNEFQIFIKNIEREPFYTMFNILFYTGIRKGELLALTLGDIDFNNNIININKTFHRLNKKDIITEPKNKSSIRQVKIDKKLVKIIKKYIKILYKPNKETRLFTITSETLKKELYKQTSIVGLPKITIHDFRHSHASFLIHKNINIIAVSRRLGHENTNITLKTYAHMYETDNDKIVEILENIED